MTFHAFDFGIFANRLGTISVRADDEGLATAVLYTSAEGGMSGRVLAASPLATGRIEFVISGEE